MARGLAPKIYDFSSEPSLTYIVGLISLQGATTNNRENMDPLEVFTLGVAIRQRATSTVDAGVATGSPFTNL